MRRLLEAARIMLLVMIVVWGSALFYAIEGHEAFLAGFEDARRIARQATR